MHSPPIRFAARMTGHPEVARIEADCGDNGDRSDGQ
jgi:hypothetical protein